MGILIARQRLGTLIRPSQRLLFTPSGVGAQGFATWCATHHARNPATSSNLRARIRTQVARQVSPGNRRLLRQSSRTDERFVESIASAALIASNLVCTPVLPYTHVTRGPHSRHAPRPLRSHRADRRWWHGGGVSGDRHQSETERRHQG